MLAAADRVVVLRGGQVVAERPTRSTTRGELAELMVGRRVARPQRESRSVGRRCSGATSVELVERGRRLLDDVSLEVRAGETLGIVGVAGNGQSALGRLFSGLLRATSGRLELFGRPLRKLEPRALVAAGVGRIPEDRQAEGVIGEMSVAENVVLERLRERRFARFGFLRRGCCAGRGRPDHRALRRARRRAPTPMRLLSGGNMQKLILGRNLVREPRLLIATQPTRGLDEGAVAAVHADILEARSAGAGVLLISEDLDEVLTLADRVQAIVRGRLSQPIPAVEADAQPARPDDGRPAGRGRAMRLERREHVPLGLAIAAPFAAALRRAGARRHPDRSRRRTGARGLSAHLVIGAFGSRLAITETLIRTTPLILTGLAAAVAFRARLWNIGAEGQFYAGALAAAALGSESLHLPHAGSRPGAPRRGRRRGRSAAARAGWRCGCASASTRW